MGNVLSVGDKTLAAEVASAKAARGSLVPDTGKSSTDQQSSHRAWISPSAKLMPLWGKHIEERAAHVNPPQ